MRVVEVSRRGGPEVLSITEREVLRPGPGQVVVDIAAAGVNFMDIYQREGVGGYRPELPFVPGAEGAGTVAAVGQDVTHLSVGDPVAWPARAADTPSRSRCPRSVWFRCRPASACRSPGPPSCRA